MLEIPWQGRHWPFYTNPHLHRQNLESRPYFGKNDTYHVILEDQAGEQFANYYINDDTVIHLPLRKNTNDGSYIMPVVFPETYILFYAGVRVGVYDNMDGVDKQVAKDFETHNDLNQYLLVELKGGQAVPYHLNGTWIRV